MDKKNLKAWLYLLPAILFLGAFMVYPLIDVLIYSAEEGYNSASQTYFGVGLYNYSYVLHDPYFLQAVKNTFILVIITVPVSTGLALLISLGLNSIKKLRNLFQKPLRRRIFREEQRAAQRIGRYADNHPFIVDRDAQMVQNIFQCLCPEQVTRFTGEPLVRLCDQQQPFRRDVRSY